MTHASSSIEAQILLNSLIGTFRSYCQKAEISFRDVKSHAIVSVDYNTKEMKRIEIFIDVEDATKPETTRKILDSAIRDCAAIHSIRAAKIFHLSIT